MRTPSKRLAGLGDIIKEAGALAQRSRHGLVRELKPDGSIVTNGDRAVETWLRQELPSFLYQSAFWGEEFGFEEPGPAGTWVVDPVDGTSNYSYGIPLWGVSIAPVKGGEIELGAVFLPDLDEVYLAERGEGAYKDGVEMALIPHGEVKPFELVSYDHNIAKYFGDTRVPGKMRCCGAFVIDGTFTATQRFRGLVGQSERLYDIAGCVAIAKELDADVRYADGSAFDIEHLCSPKQIDKPWLIFPKNSGFVTDVR